VELGKFDEPVAWFWERCFFMSELPLKITNRIERQLGNWPGVTSFLHKLCISDDESRKKEIEMKKSIDGLTRDGRKLTREVMTMATNTISLTFLCGISRRKEQLAVVQEAQKMLAGSNGNLMEIADTLSRLREKYRHLGCVGYCLAKAGGES
jgi:hypothetical protein